MSGRERVLALLLLAGLLWVGLWWPAGADPPFSADWQMSDVIISIWNSSAACGGGGGTILLATIGLFTGTLLNWAGEGLLRFSSSGPPSPPGSACPLSPASPVRPTDRCQRPVRANGRQGTDRRLCRPGARRRLQADARPEPAWWRGVTRGEWDGPGIAAELFTALLFAYLWTRCGPSWHLLELLFYASVFLLITLIDLRHRLVLNVVVIPAIPLTLLIRCLSSRPGVLSALLGGAAGLSLFLAVMLAGRGALGAGDVKLAALIGVVTGFPQVLWALGLGILAGGVGALLILITHRGGLKSYIPYAPFLCLGAMLALLHPPSPLPTV